MYECDVYFFKIRVKLFLLTVMWTNVRIDFKSACKSRVIWFWSYFVHRDTSTL